MRGGQEQKTGKRACSEFDAHVGNEIRRRRMLTDITQEDMGKALGVSFQQIQKYENGTNRISAGRLYIIAKVLGVNVNAFYEGLDPRRDDRMADTELDRVERFAMTREGKALNLAYLDAPNSQARKLALQVLRLAADRADVSDGMSRGTELAD